MILWRRATLIPNNLADARGIRKAPTTDDEPGARRAAICVRQVRGRSDRFESDVGLKLVSAVASDLKTSVLPRRIISRNLTPW